MDGRREFQPSKITACDGQLNHFLHFGVVPPDQAAPQQNKFPPQADQDRVGASMVVLFTRHSSLYS